MEAQSRLSHITNLLDEFPRTPPSRARNPCCLADVKRWQVQRPVPEASQAISEHDETRRLGGDEAQNKDILSTLEDHFHWHSIDHDYTTLHPLILDLYHPPWYKHPSIQQHPSTTQQPWLDQAHHDDTSSRY